MALPFESPGRIRGRRKTTQSPMISQLNQLSCLAQQATPSETQGGIPWPMIAVYGLLFGGFYFLFIRPQQKQAKETAKRQSALKTGDKVGTSSGIVGKVVSLDDSTITLELSTGVRIPFRRTHVVEFLSEEAKA